MYLISALVIGLLGSFHCVVMCGPLALAAPAGKGTAEWLRSRLLYQMGRIITYAGLGAVVGVLGQGLLMAGWQRGLSIAAGLLLLALAFAPTRMEQLIGMAGPLGRPVVRVKNAMVQVLKKRSKLSGFLLGLLNGFLPCGLVYLGLAGAMITGTAHEGALYMAAFGAGTLPAMLLLVLAGRFSSTIKKLQLRRLVPAAAFVMGITLIVRGLELGIPYLSPILDWVEQGIPVCGQ